MLRFAIAVACFVGLLTGEASAQGLPVPSTWTNQRGSQLTVFASGGGGSFSGQYVNQAVGFDCRGMPFDVVGQSNGGRVSFVVTWKNSFKSCNSIAVWRGTVSGNVMQTQWQLDYADLASGTIKVVRGTDTFQRVN